MTVLSTIRMILLRMWALLVLLATAVALLEAGPGLLSLNSSQLSLSLSTMARNIPRFVLLDTRAGLEEGSRAGVCAFGGSCDERRVLIGVWLNSIRE